jgi:hypothetical protein
MTLLHATWFVLELPTNMLAADLDCWETDTLKDAQQWREKLNSGEGAYGQPVKVKTEDDVSAVKLVSDLGVVHIHSAIYDVIIKQLSEPEFRVFSTDVHSLVAVLNSGSLIGAVAQLKL